jgi:ElaB/YqjD/DUF883 family membrane-anchored ribosome-binding protein
MKLSRYVTMAITGTVAVSSMAIGTTLAGSVPANATTVAHHTVTAAGRTCSAFRTWTHHRTTANIDRVMAYSVSAPWQPIGVAAVVLYTDVKSAENITADVKDMAAACKGK